MSNLTKVLVKSFSLQMLKDGDIHEISLLPIFLEKKIITENREAFKMYYKINGNYQMEAAVYLDKDEQLALKNVTEMMLTKLLK